MLTIKKYTGTITVPNRPFDNLFIYRVIEFVYSAVYVCKYLWKKNVRV